MGDFVGSQSFSMVWASFVFPSVALRFACVKVLQCHCASNAMIAPALPSEPIAIKMRAVFFCHSFASCLRLRLATPCLCHRPQRTGARPTARIPRSTTKGRSPRPHPVAIARCGSSSPKAIGPRPLSIAVWTATRLPPRRSCHSSQLPGWSAYRPSLTRDILKVCREDKAILRCSSWRNRLSGRYASTTGPRFLIWLTDLSANCPQPHGKTSGSIIGDRLGTRMASRSTLSPPPTA